MLDDLLLNSLLTKELVFCVSPANVLVIFPCESLSVTLPLEVTVIVPPLPSGLVTAPLSPDDSFDVLPDDEPEDFEEEDLFFWSFSYSRNLRL